MIAKAASHTSHMARETAEIPTAFAAMLRANEAQAKAIGEQMRAKNPNLFVTIARGSSDHAASFLKYAIELTTHLPVASIAPSTASIYGATLCLDRAIALAISQSGQSPDLVAATSMARRGGAWTLGLVNQLESPLADAAQKALGVSAGPEKSIAATKSFVNSVGLGLLLLAGYAKDRALATALTEMPKHLQAALECDWSALFAAIDGTKSLYVLGRGPSHAIAAEAALKFKETCQLHAEGLSSAEVMHGPLALLEPGFPLLALAARDAAERSSVEAATRLQTAGAQCYITSAMPTPAQSLPFVATGHPLTDSLCLIVPFYVFVEKLARQRGVDPDAPPHLGKVTVTR